MTGPPAIPQPFESHEGDVLVAADTQLRPGALRLTSVLMQSITQIAPAIGILFTIQFIASLAGVAAPLGYLFAFLIMLGLAITHSELARRLPSAGGYYTYVSNAVHPRAGFLTGWMFFLFTPWAAGLALAFTGKIVEDSLKAEYSFTFPWWAFLLLGAVVLGVTQYFGIEVSAKALLIFGGLEILIIAVLSLWGFFAPGPGGVSLSPFNPGNSPDFNGLYLAVVFGIFAFTGWEGAAPIAEESENPERNVPIAMIGSVLLMGLLFMVCAWGLLSGWGTAQLDSLVNSSELPPVVLGRRFWGDGWVVVLLAIVNSVFAVSIAATNVSTRMWYGMARTGSMPRLLGKIHPTHKTPLNAIYFQLFLVLGLGLGLGFWLGPDQAFFYWGLQITLALIFIYGAASVGVVMLFTRRLRSEFNPILHLAIPVLATAALVWVGYKSLNPLPPSPIKWAPVFTGAWFIVGVLILVVMNKIGSEAWLRQAGHSALERVETPDELAHRPRI